MTGIAGLTLCLSVIVCVDIASKQFIRLYVSIFQKLCQKCVLISQLLHLHPKRESLLWLLSPAVSVGCESANVSKQIFNVVFVRLFNSQWQHEHGMM